MEGIHSSKRLSFRVFRDFRGYEIGLGVQAPQATWRRSPVAAACWRICNRHACGFLQEATEIEEREEIACLLFLRPFVSRNWLLLGGALPNPSTKKNRTADGRRFTQIIKEFC
jgi:hypothetical protein